MRGTALSSSMPLPGARPQPMSGGVATVKKSPSQPQRTSASPQRSAGQGIKRFSNNSAPKPAPRTPRGGAGGGANRGSVEFSQT